MECKIRRYSTIDSVGIKIVTVFREGNSNNVFYLSPKQWDEFKRAFKTNGVNWCDIHREEIKTAGVRSLIECLTGNLVKV